MYLRGLLLWGVPVQLQVHPCDGIATGVKPGNGRKSVTAHACPVAPSARHWLYDLLWQLARRPGGKDCGQMGMTRSLVPRAGRPLQSKG
ncbi:hypothetical protein V1521DRAFT_423597 [Lipomyces starkeyi]